MNIKEKFEIDYPTFLSLYRIHCHFKFHLHRSMILSTILFCSGLFFERGLHINFGSINAMMLVILIASIVLNLLADFYLPKIAYKNLKMSGMSQGIVSITDNEIEFGEGINRTKRVWPQYTSCIETKEAFLLYQKDQFTILLKAIFPNQIDEVRNLLQQKVNKGKPIKRKK